MITVKEMIASDDFRQIKHYSELNLADFIRLTDCKHGIYGQYNITELGITAKDFGNAYDMAPTDVVSILSDFKRSAVLNFPTTALALVQWVENQEGDFRLSNSFAEAVLASAANAVEVETNLNSHSTITNLGLSNGRSDKLSAVLNLAANNAVDRNDTNSVWAALVALANLKNKPSPLFSSTEDEIKYLKGDVVAFFTKKNLSDRMCRAAKKLANAR